jgi:rubrerythrin
MPLNNFGSILNFAEALERRHLDFYENAARSPACTDLADRFEQLARQGRKQMQTIQRTRRENVTEMILEPIRDFYRAPYETTVDDPSGRSREAIVEDARRLEQTAEAFYQAAQEKIKALPEVARALKTIGKKRTRRIQLLEDIE